jgi:hypothetical protein
MGGNLFTGEKNRKSSFLNSHPRWARDGVTQAVSVLIIFSFCLLLKMIQVYDSSEEKPCFLAKSPFFLLSWVRNSEGRQGVARD